MLRTGGMYLATLMLLSLLKRSFALSNTVEGFSHANSYRLVITFFISIACRISIGESL